MNSSRDYHPEEALISSILRTRDCKSVIKEGIKSNFFHGYPEEAKWVFNYIERYNRVPSIRTFRTKFGSFRIIQVDDVEYYCTEVRKKHAQVLLTNSLSGVVELLSRDKIEEAVSIMHQEIIQVASVIYTTNDTNIIDDYQEIFQEVKRRKEQFDETGFSGIPTGFSTVDKATGGMKKGQLWIVAARLGHGKSWTLVRVATTAVLLEKKVQYNTLEMSRTEISLRIHTFLSGKVGKTTFTNLSLAQGVEVDLVKYSRFLRILRKNLSGKLHVADAAKGRLNLVSLEAQIERNKPDIVCIDYLTLMETSGSGDWLSLAALTNGLKQLANSTGVCIVAAAQLNRNAVGDKNSIHPGGVEDLSRSDSIGQDADVVLGYRLVTPRAMVGNIMKNRHGRGGQQYYMLYGPDRAVYNEIDYTDWLRIRNEDIADEKFKGMP